MGCIFCWQTIAGHPRLHPLSCPSSADGGGAINLQGPAYSAVAITAPRFANSALFSYLRSRPPLTTTKRASSWVSGGLNIPNEAPFTRLIPLSVMSPNSARFDMIKSRFLCVDLIVANAVELNENNKQANDKRSSTAITIANKLNHENSAVRGGAPSMLSLYMHKINAT